MALPLYEMRIEKETNSDLEVTAIALVDIPAIERNFYTFKADVNPMGFAVVNDDERLVVGPAMIPDTRIYRRNDELGEYNVFFSKETVCMIAEKFYAKSFQGNANIMHDPAQTVTGVNYFQSMVRDTAKGVIGLAGEYPEGTWFVGARIDNEVLWKKIKDGEIKGFSVEGVFEILESKADVAIDETAMDALLGEVADLLKKLKGKDDVEKFNAELNLILNGK